MATVISGDVVRGPGKVAVKLHINRKLYSLEIEPRCTLLDALRVDLQLTGTKKVCYKIPLVKGIVREALTSLV